MTQKPFGVKQLNVIGVAGTPTIESAGDLNIGGQQVAITTNTSIAGVITATSFTGGLVDVQTSGVPAIISNWNSSKHLQMSTGDNGGGFNITDVNYFAFNHQPYADRGTNNNLTERLRISSDGASFSGIVTAASFYGDGANITGISTSNITNYSGGGGGGGISGISTTGTSFFNQLNVSGVSTFNGAVDVNAHVEFKASGGNSSLYMYDENAINLGSGNDARIIYNNTGNIVKFERSGSAGEIEIDAAPVTLKHSDNTKLETTSSGVVITGIVTATSFSGTVASSNLSGALPALDGSALTNLPAASVDQNFTGIVTATSFQGNSIVGDGSDRGFTTKYYITSNGASSYRFAGPGVLNSTDDPTLYFHRGFTYILENSTGSGHPFALRVSNGGSNYSPGGNFLTGSQNGTQILTVPFDAPSSIVYQCTIHSGMVGTINFVS